MVISPVLGLYFGLKEHNLLLKKWIIIIFVTIYGSTIVFPVGSDGAVYIEVVENYYFNMGFGEFIEGLKHILQLRPDYYQRGDPYVHIVSYISGGIFQSSRIFFIIVSFIYGYFYTSSLLKIFYKFKIKKFTIPIIFMGTVLVFWEGIEGINTVRTWTGAWVLFYASISYFEKKQIKYLILIALCPMIHFAYAIISIPVWVVILFNVKPIFYTMLYAISFMFALNTGSIMDNIKGSSDLAEGRVEAYDRGDDYYAARRELHNKQHNWYVTLGQNGRYQALNLLIALLLMQGNYFKVLKRLELSLFSIALLMAAMANFIGVIPAVYTRTMRNAGIYVLAVTIMILYDGRFYINKSLKPIVDVIFLVIMVFFSIFLLYKFIGFTYYLSAFIFFNPSLPWFLKEDNIPVRDIFRIP